MKFYLVEAVTTEAQVRVGGDIAKIKLSWANGMFGAMPLFSSREDAEKYRGSLDVAITEVRIDNALLVSTKEEKAK